MKETKTDYYKATAANHICFTWTSCCMSFCSVSCISSEPIARWRGRRWTTLTRKPGIRLCSSTTSKHKWVGESQVLTFNDLETSRYIMPLTRMISWDETMKRCPEIYDWEFLYWRHASDGKWFIGTHMEKLQFWVPLALWEMVRSSENFPKWVSPALGDAKHVTMPKAWDAGNLAKKDATNLAGDFWWK